MRLERDSVECHLANQLASLVPDLGHHGDRGRRCQEDVCEGNLPINDGRQRFFLFWPTSVIAYLLDPAQIMMPRPIVVMVFYNPLF